MIQAGVGLRNNRDRKPDLTRLRLSLFDWHVLPISSFLVLVTISRITRSVIQLQSNNHGLLDQTKIRARNAVYARITVKLELSQVYSIPNHADLLYTKGTSIVIALYEVVQQCKIVPRPPLTLRCCYKSMTYEVEPTPTVKISNLITYGRAEESR